MSRGLDAATGRSMGELGEKALCDRVDTWACCGRQRFVETQGDLLLGEGEGPGVADDGPQRLEASIVENRWQHVAGFRGIVAPV